MAASSTATPTPPHNDSATHVNGHANTFDRDLLLLRHQQQQQREHQQVSLDRLSQSPPTRNYQPIPPQYLPGGRKSLPGISIRAFSLGVALGFCSLSAVQLAWFGHALWRIPFFVATLAVFHYLEFDMTARFNPPDGQVSSFLLFNNGSAYTVAHMTAMVETTARIWLRSKWWSSVWVRLGSLMGLSSFGGIVWEMGWTSMFPTLPTWITIVLGLVLVAVGQTVRSLAMAHAKTNFNHIVQSTKKSDHVLITDGVYSFSRHPSYFGFFWWGLGTQLVLGNHFCFLAYTVLLWNFFSRRIRGEEKHLVHFFGRDYLHYREKVGVWIPFIR